MKQIEQHWEKDGFILRSIRAEDEEAYWGIFPMDPEVVRLTGGRADFLIIGPDGRILGESVVNEIDWKTRCGNFRIAIFRSDNCGKGIGSWAVRMTRDFAFEALGLHRLELDVFSFNPRAVRAYEKSGFRREGVRREAVLDGTAYGDDILMAILEDEWRKIKRTEQTEERAFNL